MTEEDKAKELVEKIYNSDHCTGNHFPNKNYCECVAMSGFQAKKCAIIAVDEIILSNPINPCDLVGVTAEQYWQQVKNELKQM